MPKTEPDSNPSPTHPVLEEMVQHQTRKGGRPAMLPAFSFNPAQEEDTKTPSPTKTTFASGPPSSSRSPRYRRRGSDLVGASERCPTAPQPLSASPQKSALAVSPGNEGRSRHTHQHRRSQAVSITELDTSELIKANAVSIHRAGSIPSTPTDTVELPGFPHRGQSIQGNDDHEHILPQPRRGSASNGHSNGRSKVGFSETIDLIPRPLSMISSETEDSCSTVRGRHSLTGSINSLGSPTTRPASAPCDKPDVSPRPQTADAASPSLQTREDAHEALRTDAKSPRPYSSSDSADVITACDALEVRTADESRVHSESLGSGMQVSNNQAHPAAAIEQTIAARKHKVRMLTNGIFGRKPRSRQLQANGSEPSTTVPRSTSANLGLDDVFDADSTVVITESSSDPEQQRAPPLVANVPEFDVSSSGIGGDENITSPALDLDAALGHFGSEESLPQTGFAAARTRMHSSIGAGATDAFGVAHRRAESAPQMSSPNKNVMGLRRLGSDGIAADDVFDEEEEDNFLAKQQRDLKASPDNTLLHKSDQVFEARTISEQELAPPPTAQRASCTPGPLVRSRSTLDGIQIVDAEESIAREEARSSDSTLTGPESAEDHGKQTAPNPSAFALPTSQTSYASSSGERSEPSSAVPSLDADQVTFENSRRFYSNINQSSPDAGVFPSTEDVPSLCHSESTGIVPRISSGAGTQSSSDQYSTIISPPTTSSSRSNSTQAAWKRASLASLNRFMSSSSLSDKSRLCHEQSAENAEQEQVKRKGKRVSRLMSFWRSKERVGK